MKLIRVLVLILLTPTSFLFAQLNKTDSTAIKTELALDGAKHFKLDKQVWKAFRKHRFAYTSDYFKPNIDNVSDPKLLLDSGYVKAFKIFAQKKTTKRRTIGHYILIGEGTILAISTAVLIIQLATGTFRI